MRKAIALLLVLSLISSVEAMNEKVLVIGLDGATLTTVKPWMDEGKLPNMKKLADKGVTSNLSSVVPYVSPVAWASFMTGNRPGKHGVYGFQQAKPGKYKPFIPMGNDVHGKTLWKILSENGKKPVVINVLMTYPIEDGIDGVVIGGMMSPGIAVKPAKYKPWLEKQGYITEGKGFLNTEKDEFLESLYETTDRRIEASIKLMDEEPDWDFFMVLISGTDRIQHYMWGDMMDKDPKFGKAIEDYYIHCDKLIGEMLEKAGPDTNVILLSDHGFGRQSKKVHINHWLIENGFLKLEDGWENKKTMWTIRLSGFLKETGLSEVIRKGLVHFFKGEKADMQPPKVKVDYSKETSVFTPAYYTGHLYMNPKLDPEEYQLRRDELMKKLRELKDPETGEKIIKEVYAREELYKGEYVYMAPDVILVPAGDYWIVGGLNYYRLIEPVHRDTGQHRMDGLMIAAGPGIVKKDGIYDADLVDIAPTVLDMFGIGSDMDGKVLKDILR